MNNTASTLPGVSSAAASRNTGQGHFRVWVDQPQAFSTQRVEAIHHNFHEHPLMQLPELAKLARDLAATKQCRFITPRSQQSSVFAHYADNPDGGSVDDVFQRIEEPGSWVALYNVETHPVYRAFLAEVTTCVRPLVNAQQPGMYSGRLHLHLCPSLGDAVSHGQGEQLLVAGEGSQDNERLGPH